MHVLAIQNCYSKTSCSVSLKTTQNIYFAFFLPVESTKLCVLFTFAHLLKMGYAAMFLPDEQMYPYLSYFSELYSRAVDELLKHAIHVHDHLFSLLFTVGSQPKLPWLRLSCLPYLFLYLHLLYPHLCLPRPSFIIPKLLLIFPTLSPARHPLVCPETTLVCAFTPLFRPSLLLCIYPASLLSYAVAASGLEGNLSWPQDRLCRQPFPRGGGLRGTNEVVGALFKTNTLFSNSHAVLIKFYGIVLALKSTPPKK